jgi:hypothetical protein
MAKIDVKYISRKVVFNMATYVPTGVTSIIARQEWTHGLWVIPIVSFTNDISSYADWGMEAVPAYAPVKGVDAYWRKGGL